MHAGRGCSTLARGITNAPYFFQAECRRGAEYLLMLIGRLDPPLDEALRQSESGESTDVLLIQSSQH